jgi:hypothetical protein
MEWKNMVVNIKESQLDFYKRNNACPEIQQLVGLESKAFGMHMEKITRQIFRMNKPLNSQHDGIFNGVKIEIKSSRFWGGTTNCRFQHIEPTYDYDYVLFVLVNFQDIEIYGMSKDRLKEMIALNILTPQGRQGYWCQKSKIKNYLTPIKSKEDLEKLI